MTIDSASLAYANRPLQVPRALQGSGARMASGAAVDRSSPLYAQCQEFESLFVKIMLKEMRATVGKGGLLDGGYAEDIFQDMLDDEYAKGMTRNAGFGLADSVYIELTRGV